MPGISSQQPQRTWLAGPILGIVLFLLLGLWVVQFEPQVVLGQTSKKYEGQKELEDLQKIVGATKVAIYLQNNPAVLKGRLIGLSQILGRTYLQLRTDQGLTSLINTDAIAAICQEF